MLKGFWKDLLGTVQTGGIELCCQKTPPRGRHRLCCQGRVPRAWWGLPSVVNIHPVTTHSHHCSHKCASGSGATSCVGEGWGFRFLCPQISTQQKPPSLLMGPAWSLCPQCGKGTLRAGRSLRAPSSFTGWTSPRLWVHRSQEKGRLPVAAASLVQMCGQAWRAEP